MKIVNLSENTLYEVGAIVYENNGECTLKNVNVVNFTTFECQLKGKSKCLNSDCLNLLLNYLGIDSSKVIIEKQHLTFPWDQTDGKTCQMELCQIQDKNNNLSSHLWKVSYQQGRIFCSLPFKTDRSSKLSVTVSGPNPKKIIYFIYTSIIKIFSLIINWGALEL